MFFSAGLSTEQEPTALSRFRASCVWPLLARESSLVLKESAPVVWEIYHAKNSAYRSHFTLPPTYCSPSHEVSIEPRQYERGGIIVAWSAEQSIRTP